MADKTVMSLSKEKIVAIYHEVFFESRGEVGVSNNDDPLLYIKRYLPGNLDAYVLDAGCGNGRYMRRINELAYENVYGIDLFEEVAGLGSHYVCGNIEAIPFPDESFDMVYSTSVVYYSDRPKEAFKEFFRVLRPGGCLLITAHTKYSLFTLDRILKRRFKPSLVRHLEGVTFYSSIQYKNMLEEAGFTVIEIDGFRLSYFLRPFIEKSRRAVSKLIKAPNIIASILGKEVRNRQGNRKRNRTWGLLRSIFCYHAVLVGRK